MYAKTIEMLKTTYFWLIICSPCGPEQSVPLRITLTTNGYEFQKSKCYTFRVPVFNANEDTFKKMFMYMICGDMYYSNEIQLFTRKTTLPPLLYSKQYVIVHMHISFGKTIISG